MLGYRIAPIQGAVITIWFPWLGNAGIGDQTVRSSGVKLRHVESGSGSPSTGPVVKSRYD
jgi:hypothetical protein